MHRFQVATHPLGKLSALRPANARTELHGALLRDNEDEKRLSVSGSIVEYGRADTLGVSQACCAARMP